MDTTLIKQYRRAVAVVRDLPTFLADNDKVWTKFQYYTNSNYNQVIQLLSTTSKPKIIPVWDMIRKGWPCWGNTPSGVNNPLKGVAIEIRQNLLSGLEMAKLKTTIYDSAFLLATVLLHELVHFVRDINKLPGDDFEYGTTFVEQGFGVVIDDTNAAYHNHYQHSFINLKWEIRHDKIINNSNKY